MKNFLFACLTGFLILTGSGCAPVSVSLPTQTGSTSMPQDASSAGDQSSGVFFDDFSYSAPDEMAGSGWIIREGMGWPGVTGARFRPDNVSFVDAPDLPGNRLLRMTSSTDGTAEGTFQTQLCQQRKFFEGTYAARVRFRDEPEFGPDGDQIVETFYAITPYVRPMALDYSEMDFEYLPNGGWGSAPSVFYVTTWETVQIEPWNAVNVSSPFTGSMAGWRTLVAQVGGGEVRYYVDDRLIAQHGGHYYPDSPMSINFNLWFIDNGLSDAGGLREYHQDIDWVFFAQDAALTQSEVEAEINSLRDNGIPYQDNIPAADPVLDSPCDL